MSCWSCYWGWPKPVADIYARAVEKLDGYWDPLHFGPAHLVWSDENFDGAEWCLKHFDEFKGDCNEAELEIVKQSLEELSQIPIDIRCVEPPDYDSKHPENFPPPEGIEMIKGQF